MPRVRAWLEQRIGANVIRLHRLEDRSFLGSSEGSVVPLAATAGMRPAPLHCTIEREGNVFRLRDVRADRRGTLVNHRYVKSAVLVAGDVIQVGGVALRFRTSGANTNASLRRDSCP